MMKKFLLGIGMLLIFAGSAHAFSYPRWLSFPVTVYLPPEYSQSEIVKGAFANWQANSKYIARFIYKKSTVARKTADIKVEFYDTLPSKKAYELDATYNTYPVRYKKTSDGYFFHVVLKIALQDDSGKLYTRKQLSAISLQAVGRALGVPCIDGDRGVMVCDGKYNVYSVTKEDYEALFKVYKRVNKSKLK